MLTAEDIQLLQPYEEQMRTAIRSNYSRYVPPSIVARMVEIRRRATPGYRINTRCPRCVLQLLKEVGCKYFNTKGHE